MNWTGEKPTETGWYWYRGACDNGIWNDIPVVTYVENGTAWQPFMDYYDGLDAFDGGKWAGPLLPPVD